MKLTARLAFSLMLISSLIPLSALAENFERLKTLKIAYVYNFTRFIDWGPNQSDVFHLCLMSEDPDLHTAFLHLIRKSTRQMPVEVMQLSEPDDIQTCQLLYISDTAAPTGLASEQWKHTLIISDQSHIDAQIHFRVISNKLRFNIHRAQVEAKGLSISSKLLRLAHEVY